MFNLISREIKREDSPQLTNCEPRDRLTKEGQPSYSSTIIKEEPVENFPVWTPVPERFDVSFEIIPKQEGLEESRCVAETISLNQQSGVKRTWETVRNSLIEDVSECEIIKEYQPEPTPASPTTSEDDLFEFKCEFCSKVYKTLRGLEDHVADAHVVDKEFECLKCSGAFISQEKLESHILATHDYRPYKCQTCDKGFSNVDNLTEHEKTHGNEEPLTKCDSSSGSLAIRSRFQCSKCKRAFISQEKLESHKLATHIYKHKPYKKRVTCGKGIPSGDNRTEKEKTCRNEKSRQFNLSFGSFSTSQSMFQCSRCSRAFISQNNLDEHVYERHLSSYFPESYILERKLRTQKETPKETGV